MLTIASVRLRCEFQQQKGFPIALWINNQRVEQNVSHAYVTRIVETRQAQHIQLELFTSRSQSSSPGPNWSNNSLLITDYVEPKRRVRVR